MRQSYRVEESIASRQHMVKSDWKQGEDVGEQLEDVLFLLLGMIDAVPV